VSNARGGGGGGTATFVAHSLIYCAHQQTAGWAVCVLVAIVLPSTNAQYTMARSLRYLYSMASALKQNRPEGGANKKNDRMICCGGFLVAVAERYCL